MRRNARIDANQPEVVRAFRSCGATVGHTHMVGDGFPDIVVGFGGDNYLIEIKDGDKPPSGRKLTSDEEEWHREWRGSVHIIESADQAVEFMQDRHKKGDSPVLGQKR